MVPPAPQIHEERGLTGRQNMKQPTEYKGCNVVVIEKRRQSGWTDRGIGGCYGPRAGFDE